MISSMTGFAARQGAGHGYHWAWELRSVNGRGLDLRLRVPDWIDGLEPALRKSLAAAAKRGNVTCSLRMQRDDRETGHSVNLDHVDRMLAVVQQIEERARGQGVVLAPTRAGDILALRGVLDQGGDSDDTGPLRATLEAECATLVAEFQQMRQTEGAALAAILTDHLHTTSEHVAAAQALLPQREEVMGRQFAANLAKLVDATDTDPARLAQELAQLAVKSDVTEEIDRLHAHVAAARDLLGQGGAVGRKLDFLMQEFNREANTLCSKAQMSALTEIGLALKVVIDQMREQVQNVE